MNPLNNILSPELTNKIEKFACKRVVNGNKKSNELILIFEVNETATKVHDKLLQWLFKCLDTISEKFTDNNSGYRWSIVSGISMNECDTDYLANIIVAIHIDTEDPYSYDNDNSFLIVPYDYNSLVTIAPQDILDCLINEPIFVIKIGVSAVSSNVMMDFWKDIITTNYTDMFEIRGKGFRKHPMWVKYHELHHELDHPNDPEWGNWSKIRECSYRFKWKGYMELWKEQEQPYLDEHLQHL